MQKPPYLKIYFPVSQKDFNPAVKKYFKHLAGHEVIIRFCQERNRKKFNYYAHFSMPESWSCLSSKKSVNNFVVGLYLDQPEKK